MNTWYADTLVCQLKIKIIPEIQRSLKLISCCKNENPKGALPQRGPLLIYKISDWSTTAGLCQRASRPSSLVVLVWLKCLKAFCLDARIPPY